MAPAASDNPFSKRGMTVKRDFLHVDDLTTDEIWQVLDIARDIKARFKRREDYKPFKDHSLAMIFNKPSARTRISFETGFYRMGGHAVYLTPQDIEIGVREAVKDIARVVSRYNDIIMARLFDHAHILELAEYASVPVINALTDYNHPCQVMGDIMTCRERGKDILHLAEHLLAQKAGDMGRGTMALSPRAIQAITTYQWPGNVRELEHAIERAVVLSDGEEIENEALGIDLELVNVNRLRGQRIGGATGQRQPISNDPPEDLSLEDYFQRFVLEHQDSMSETELAQKLGISRKCLWERRQRFGIPRKKGNTGGSRARRAAS